MKRENPRISRLSRALSTLGLFDTATECNERRKALYQASTTELDLPLIEYQTIRDLCDLGGIEGGDDRAALEAALIALFVARREGSLCIPLSEEGIRERLPEFAGREELATTFLAATRAGKYQSVVATRRTAGSAKPLTYLPLALENDRLYFQRYLAAEDLLREVLAVHFAAETPGQGSPDFREHVAAVLANPVRDPGSGKSIHPGEDQKLALALSLLRNGVIITGGPGTGKTSIVFAILRVLLRAGIPASRIGLAAPTGRAAQRVGESLRTQFDRLPEANRVPAEEEIRSILPATIHRLLGYSQATLGFRHQRRHPLDLDVVIVDEASMIDVELMARLLDATPPQAKVILLGDADQLPSVEAGAVLADLVRGQRTTCLSDLWKRRALDLLQSKGAEHAKSPRRPRPDSEAPFSDHLIVLRESFRSVREILTIAEAVNSFPEQESDAAREIDDLVAAFDSGGACLLDRRATCDQETFAARLGDWVNEFCRGDGPNNGASEPSYDSLVRSFCQARFASDDLAGHQLLRAIFRLIDRRRLLTVFREGPFGSEGINEVVSGLLRKRLGVDAGRFFFPGEVVMVTRNDYRLELFNGDTGVILPEENGGLVGIFPRPDGFLRVPVEELPAPVPAFAVTVHKSQGSEFDEVVLIVPSSPIGTKTAGSGAERILTREIIYTGLTRAKKRITVWTDDTAFFNACRRRVRRTSGLWLDRAARANT